MLFLCKKSGLSGLFGSYSFDCSGCPVLWFEQTVVVQRVGLILGRADQLGLESSMHLRRHTCFYAMSAFVRSYIAAVVPPKCDSSISEYRLSSSVYQMQSGLPIGADMILRTQRTFRILSAPPLRGGRTPVALSDKQPVQRSGRPGILGQRQVFYRLIFLPDALHHRFQRQQLSG